MTNKPLPAQPRPIKRKAPSTLKLILKTIIIAISSFIIIFLFLYVIRWVLFFLFVYLVFSFLGAAFRSH